MEKLWTELCGLQSNQKGTSFFFSNILAFPIFTFKGFFKQKAEERILIIFSSPTHVSDVTDMPESSFP